MTTYHGIWLWIWGAFFAAATALFAGITVVVAIRGGAELRRLFRGRK